MPKDISEMNSEELKAYEESLDLKLSQNAIKVKADAVSKIELADKEAKKEAAKADEKARDAAAETRFFANNPQYAKHNPLDTGKEQKPKEDTPFSTYYNHFYDKYKTTHTPSKYTNPITKVSGVEVQIANTVDIGTWENLYMNTDSDTGCEDDVSDWSPADVYSRIIWNTFSCKADLFKICVKGIAINPGEGLSVQIRTYGKLSDPSELASCECLSCASITFSVYPLTLKQYGKEVIVCEKDIWDVGSVLMDTYMNALADMWATWFDYQIYSELESASPGTTETLTTALACDPTIEGSCCTDTALMEMYNAVNAIVASMREGTTPYDPDYMLISPSVANIFKRMQSPTVTFSPGDVRFDDAGRLTKIAGLNVIEYCRANACTDATGEVVAIIIDSRRAVGAVFGQRPQTYKFFQSNCNSTRVDSWAFFACGELDTGAIAHIVNP